MKLGFPEEYSDLEDLIIFLDIPDTDFVPYSKEPLQPLNIPAPEMNANDFDDYLMRSLLSGKKSSLAQASIAEQVSSAYFTREAAIKQADALRESYTDSYAVLTTTLGSELGVIQGLLIPDNPEIIIDGLNEQLMPLMRAEKAVVDTHNCFRDSSLDAALAFAEQGLAFPELVFYRQENARETIPKIMAAIQKIPYAIDACSSFRDSQKRSYR